MAMEQGLYAKGVIFHRKDLNITEENKDKNDDKFKFQGQVARSQRWFDLDFDCIQENFSTHEPDFYKKIYQSHDDTQDTNTLKMLVVTIGNAKNVDESNFHIDAPTLKYNQNT